MSSKTTERRTRWLAKVVLAAIMASSTLGVANALDSSPTSTGQLVRSDIEGLALRWFAQMRAGQIDRSQLTASYNSQLTDEAVLEMSKFLKEYEFGATPVSAQVLLKRSGGDQTFYVVKIAFPRGDAASLMFGFGAEGKITGVSLMSMAGD